MYRRCSANSHMTSWRSNAFAGPRNRRHPLKNSSASRTPLLSRSSKWNKPLASEMSMSISLKNVSNLGSCKFSSNSCHEIWPLWFSSSLPKSSLKWLIM
eukprot:CAMPEP_0203855020 /NCGR_PEP_ID=MMETSP0359-20131031/9411_1 /ASSEMBLY_ACC=CAM_ASM_000338 /TAXON_ID=268821 /ORGANISM="Scrippsiella Hangoei, Strain SHTV-5" /LENGTH=98 /DNA_ID=CAMNT_0050771539 /DNA_START=271 /DNA_END=567 /DNA_ORIENTATION=-